MLRVVYQLLFVGVVAAAFTGCSGGTDDTPPIGTVEGTVSLDGELVPNAFIVYKPLEGGRISNGVSDANGHYVVEYKTNVPGAKVGQHQVMVWTATDEQGDPGTEGYKPAGEETIPKKYLDSNSELKVEVKAGENTIPLDLTS